MPTYSQLRIECDALGEDAQVHRMSGHETLSQLFEVEVVVVVPASSNVFGEDILGSPATLIFDRVDEGDRATEIRQIHGMVAQCDDLLLPGDFLAFRLHVAPRMWVASIVETLDIYMEQSIPDIIKGKLELLDMAEGVDFEMRLSDNYPAKEFVVQYKETDLAFISRLTEHVGITFFFEHDSGRDRIIFSDRNSAFRPLDRNEHVPFVAGGQEVGVFELNAQHRIVPRMYVQRDYNYRNPATDLTASAEIPEAFGGGIIEYGGHFKTEGEGKWLAEIRSQERNAERRVFRGRSDVGKLAAGRKMMLDGHLRGDLSLVLTSVRHEVRQTSMMGGHGDEVDYRNEFTALLEGTEYRPPRVTPRPRIGGTVTGIVDAAAKGQYAELDDEGRYHVKFMFDTSAAGEGKASRAVRMMQPHSGAGYGMHFPLRPGIEVLITFMDGDPDRPVIAGTVPNPQTASPVVSENAARNVIRTGGGNEINIDDTEDEQRIKMTVPTSNTLFQLGAPNGPENGALLQTTGAYTNCATVGQTSIGTLDAGISAFKSFKSSGDISTVAKKKSRQAKWLALGVALFEVGVMATEAVIAAIEVHHERLEKEKTQEATKKAEKATAAQLACKACRDTAKAALPPSIADIQAKCTVCTGAHPSPPSGSSCLLTAEEQATLGLTASEQAEYTAKRDAALAYMDQMDASDAAYDKTMSQRSLHNGAVANAAEQSTDQHDRAVVLKEQSTAEGEAKALIASELAIDGTGGQSVEDALQPKYEQFIRDRATNDDGTPKYDPGDPLDAADQAAADALVEANKGDIAKDMGLVDANGDGDPTATLTSATDNKNAANAPLAHTPAFSAFDTEMAKCAGSSDSPCCDDLKAARDAATQSNKEYNDLITSHGPAKDELTRAKTALAAIKTAKALISAIIALYATIKSLFDKAKANVRWGMASTAYATSGVIGAVPTVVYASPMHTIGAENSTELYGEKSLLLWSKNVTIFGCGTKPDPDSIKDDPPQVPDPTKGKVYVMGPELTHMASNKKTIVSAFKEMLFQSPIVKISAENQTSSLGELTVLSIKDTKMSSTSGNINIEAKTKNIGVKAAAGEVKTEAKSYKLDVTTKAELLAKSELKAKVGTNGLSLSTSKSQLYFAKNQLFIDAKESQLIGGTGKLFLDAQGAQVEGTKVTVASKTILKLDGSSLITIG